MSTDGESLAHAATDGESDRDSSASVAVVGSYNAGIVMDVPSIPIPGETVLGENFAEGPGGKGSNQAIGAARLGADASFVGCVGDDGYGDEAIDLWGREEVDHDGVVRTDETHTGVGIVLVDEHGENAIGVAPGANWELDAAAVDRAREEIADRDALLCQLEVRNGPIDEATAIAAEAGLDVILNPAPARELPAEILERVDYLTPNQAEARVLAGVDPDSSIGDETVADRLRDLGVGTVVLTCGERGAIVVTDEGTEQIPAPTVDVVDTTGAGDAFNAGLAVALAEGLDPIAAVRFGCRVGAHAVTAREVIPGLPTRGELESVPDA